MTTSKRNPGRICGPKKLGVCKGGPHEKVVAEALTKVGCSRCCCRWEAFTLEGFFPAQGERLDPGRAQGKIGPVKVLCDLPPGFHPQFTVIDGTIFWYGSVNVLSFGKAEESVMRLESREIAGELIDTVIKDASESERDGRR